MREWAAYSREEKDGRTTFVVTGPLLISTIGALDREFRAFEGQVDAIDVSHCGAVDTVGAWVVLRFAREHESEIVGANDQAQRLLKAVEEAKNTAAIAPPRSRLRLRVPETVGRFVYEYRHGGYEMLGFAGHIIVALLGVLKQIVLKLLWLDRAPLRLRIKAVVRQFELVGVSALGIIGLMSFLIGIVIAQQGAAQLAQFGAEIYTINLTGRLSLRELGVLMTAIMVAGRSGSSFAAQLGTMKLTEEIDAMRTIGVSPMEALVLPRVIAAVVMMPLLGFYAAILSIIGGASIAALTLNIPFGTFLGRIQQVVPLYDVWVGLIKAPVFGLIVALSGCYQGMQVEGNSEEVGLRTTLAVVQAIFLVIVLDAFFAVFFDKVGWA